MPHRRHALAAVLRDRPSVHDSGEVVSRTCETGTYVQPSFPRRHRDPIATPSRPYRDPIATPSRRHRDTFAILSRYLRDTFAIPSRYLGDPIATPSRHACDTLARHHCETPSRVTIARHPSTMDQLQTDRQTDLCRSVPLSPVFGMVCEQSNSCDGTASSRVIAYNHPSSIHDCP